MRVPKPSVVLLVLGVMLGGWLSVAGARTAQAATTTVTVSTDADAYVSSAAPRKRFGTADQVLVDASPTLRGYFRFTVSVPAGQAVQSAVFQCWAESSNASGGQLYPAGSGWSERTIVYAKAPAPDLAHPLGSTGAVTAGTWVSADATAAVAGSGTYTLVMTTGSSNVWGCAAREGTDPRARLVVTSGSSAPPPVTGTVVDAIGDGGPDTAHWNTPLAQRVVADNPALFLWPGDVRMTGTPAEWKLYDANYGALKLRTLPTPGNHDWGTATSGYDLEFASDPYADTVSYCNAVPMANGWAMFSINTYTQAACLPKLREFLAAPGTRKIVLTHEPRWSGGSHGDSTAQAPIWDAMKGHAFALVSGHDHDSQVIERDGMVQVVNGCAGADYYAVNPAETGLVYYSTSAADCTFERFTLGTSTVTVQAVHADGSVDFSKTYTVTP